MQDESLINDKNLSKENTNTGGPTPDPTAIPTAIPTATTAAIPTSNQGENLTKKQKIIEF